MYKHQTKFNENKYNVELWRTAPGAKNLQPLVLNTDKHHIENKLYILVSKDVTCSFFIDIHTDRQERGTHWKYFHGFQSSYVQTTFNFQRQ